MTRIEIADRISRLPETYAATDCSTATLIQESGFLEAPEELGAEDVEKIMRDKPRLTERWLERWNDQRIAGGWVMDCEDGAYHLKNFSTGREIVIGDKFQACAEFAVRYVRRIGRVIAKYESPSQPGYRR